MVFQGKHCVDFVENALFKRSGDINLSQTTITVTLMHVPMVKYIHRPTVYAPLVHDLMYMYMY